MEQNEIPDFQIQIMLHHTAFHVDIETTFKYYLGEIGAKNKIIRSKFLLYLIEYLYDTYYKHNILEDHLITTGIAKRIAFKILNRFQL